MDQVNPPTLDPSILEANLSALRQQDATLADRLCQILATLDPLTPAITRDGHLSVRITATPAKTSRDREGVVSDWFGRTSIPSVRASALVDRFDTGQANVLLPGIGQGCAVTLLLNRLGRHRAVFVWEPDVSAILIAMHLHDWAQALTEQRLVFIVCPPEQLTVTLTAWLADHPGHLCPDRIMMWPWSTPPELASCRASVQTAYHDTQRHRSEALESVRAQLAGAGISPGERRAEGSSPLGSGAVVALMSTHANEETWALSKALSDAGGHLGWSVVELGIRRPGNVHSLARARVLVEHAGRRPHAAILLDTTRNEVRDILPDATPTVSWLGPRSSMVKSMAARIGPCDLVAVTSSRVRDRMTSAGVAPDRILVAPYPCLAPSGPPEDAGPSDRPIDLALIADLSPTAPEPFGHKLPTHTQLWNAAVELIEQRIGTFTEDQGDSIVAQAEAKLDIRIEDRSIRSAMVEALSTCVANTLLWRKMSQLLINNDVKVAFCGRGWSETGDGHPVYPLATLVKRWQILRQSKLCLYADVTGEVSSSALLAAAAGSVLVARSHPRDAEPGGLATLLKPDRDMVLFARIEDLIATLRRLLKNSDFRRKIADAAADRCQSEHLPGPRLASLSASATSFFEGARSLI